MSLTKDIEEATELWTDASLPTRGVIVLMLFLSASSITSLSDVVFKWKGFILEGVEFYRFFVTGPLMHLAAAVGLSHFDQLEVDGLILFGLLLSVAWRSQRRELIPRHFETWGSLGLVLGLVTGGLSSDPPSLADALVPIMMLEVLLVTGVAMYQIDRKEFFRMYRPVLFGLTAVLLLGAVNAGFQKPIP